MLMEQRVYLAQPPFRTSQRARNVQTLTYEECLYNARYSPQALRPNRDRQSGVSPSLGQQRWSIPCQDQSERARLALSPLVQEPSLRPNLRQNTAYRCSHRVNSLEVVGL